MTELPTDYPHEKGIYVAGSLVELVGANIVTRASYHDDPIVTHELYYCWFDNENNGIRKEDLHHFRADGGLSTLYDTLLSLPDRRVDGKDLLQ